MVGGGQLDGKCYLSRKTVEFMPSNHIVCWRYHQQTRMLYKNLVYGALVK